MILKLYFVPESPEVLLKKESSRFRPQSSEWAYECWGPRKTNFEQGPQVIVVQAGGTMGFEKHCQQRIGNFYLCLCGTYLFTSDNNDSKWLEGKWRHPRSSLSTPSTQPVPREVELAVLWVGFGVWWWWWSFLLLVYRFLEGKQSFQ